MKILVSGSSGFVGKRLLDFLDNDVKITQIVALARKPAKPLSSKVRAYSMDLTHSESLMAEKSIEGADVIIHLAGSPGVWFSRKHPADDLKCNALTLASILEYAERKKVKKIILASTCQVQPNETKTMEQMIPGNFYALSKRVAEHYLQLYCSMTKTQFVILRMSWIYGPGMTKNPIYDLIHHSDEEEIELLNSLEDELDFIYVDDVARALCQAALRDEWSGKILNISSGQTTSITDLISLLEGKTGKRYRFRSPTTKARRVKSDNSASQSLGWQPEINLREGFSRTFDFFARSRHG